jgi:hypothetical protein
MKCRCLCSATLICSLALTILPFYADSAPLAFSSTLLPQYDRKQCYPILQAKRQRRTVLYVVCRGASPIFGVMSTLQPHNLSPLQFHLLGKDETPGDTGIADASGVRSRAALSSGVVREAGIVLSRLVRPIGAAESARADWRRVGVRNTTGRDYVF